MDKHSYKILKKLYSSGSIPFEQFLALLGCTLENYRDSSAFEAISEYVEIVKILPSGSDDEDGVPVFTLTPSGESAVEQYFQINVDRVCSRVAIVISFAALILSAVALCHSW